MSGEMSGEREILTFEEAEALLPGGEEIHTYRNAAFGLIGADWSRGDLLEAMRQHEISKSGPMATGTGHGMVLIDDAGPLFIATKKAL